MSACTCRPHLIRGPGTVAAELLYESQIRAERTASGRRFRPRGSDLRPGSTLSLISASLESDAPVRFDLRHWARLTNRPEESLRADTDWLVEHRFLALDGAVNAIVRVWVNPAVGGVGGTDPRTSAARHRFPYPALQHSSTSGPEPVRFIPYNEVLWEYVYQANRDFWDQTTIPASRCPSHRRPHLQPV